MRHSHCALILALASSIGTLSSQNSEPLIQPLDVKTGLWEFTKTSRASYPMPQGLPPEVAKVLTAAQRAQYQETLRKSAEASAKGTETKSTACLRQIDLDRGNLLGPSPMFPGCVNQAVTSTPQLLAVACPAGKGQLSQDPETLRFERVDSEHFKGEIHLGAGDTPSTVSQSIKARWMAASCGNEPPVTDEPALVTVSVIKPGVDYLTLVANHSSSVMTAYSVFIYNWGNKGNIYRRFYDGSAAGHRTVKAGGSVEEQLDGIVVHAKIAAALFADGTTFGPPKEVATLKDAVGQAHAALAQKIASGPKDLSFLLPPQPMVPVQEGYYVAAATPTDHWPPSNARLLHLYVNGTDISVMEVMGRGGVPKERLWVRGPYTSNPFRGEIVFHSQGGDITKPIETAFRPDALYVGSTWFHRLSDAAVGSAPTH